MRVISDMRPVSMVDAGAGALGGSGGGGAGMAQAERARARTRIDRMDPETAWRAQRSKQLEKGTERHGAGPLSAGAAR